MDTATAAVSEEHLVEAKSLDVPAGVPTITVRFLVEPSSEGEENQEAQRVSAQMQHAVAAIAHTGRLRTLRRQRGRWLLIG